MTEAQSRVLEVIRKFINSKGYSPSYEEIARNCGFTALATVNKHVTALERQGYLTFGYNRARSIALCPAPEIYGLKSCDQGHEKIYFGSVNCPLCPFIVGNAREVSIDTERR